MATGTHFASVQGRLGVGEQLTIVFRKPKVTIRPRVTECEPERFLEWRGTLGISGLFDGCHRFELTPTGKGTHLRQHEDFSGILVPFFRGILKQTEKGFVAFNKGLKSQAEQTNSPELSI